MTRNRSLIWACGMLAQCLRIDHVMAPFLVASTPHAWHSFPHLCPCPAAPTAATLAASALIRATQRQCAGCDSPRIKTFAPHRCPSHHAHTHSHAATRTHRHSALVRPTLNRHLIIAPTFPTHSHTHPLARTQHELATHYQRGAGVARDDAIAADLFRRAADAGHAGTLISHTYTHTYTPCVEEYCGKAVISALYISHLNYFLCVRLLTFACLSLSGARTDRPLPAARCRYACVSQQTDVDSRSFAVRILHFFISLFFRVAYAPRGFLYVKTRLPCHIFRTVLVILG